MRAIGVVTAADINFYIVILANGDAPSPGNITYFYNTVITPLGWTADWVRDTNRNPSIRLDQVKADNRVLVEKRTQTRQLWERSLGGVFVR